MASKRPFPNISSGTLSCALPHILKVYPEHMYVHLFQIWDHTQHIDPYKLLGDVGGQRTLRPYWRNYFEQTDALVWVVDSGDRMRMADCKEELHSLLTEDVSNHLQLTRYRDSS